MQELPSDAPESRVRESRLDSWKEIAAYLRRDVSTVQRWEKREGMPVHRHLHDKLGSVYALPSELDAWSQSRTRSAERETPVVDAFWPNPLAGAQFAPITDFEGAQQAAAISRDGKFVAFLSNRDGRTDVWITQIGGGQFYNLTRGTALDVVNPDVRALCFSPDGALVMFWARTRGGSAPGRIGIWAVPTLGGQPRPYLDDVSEIGWSESGRLVYHTPEPGDPTFVTDLNQTPPGRQIFAGSPGRHAHFPVWSLDEAFIYFVGGVVPNGTDLWRIRSDGGTAERLTFHNSRVTYPTFVNRRTLLYLASGPDGSGPWLHALDVGRPAAHRIGSGVDQYTSLAISGDRMRLVATRANPKTSLWRVQVADTPAAISNAIRVALTTGSGHSPRFGPGYLLYVSSRAASDSLWKFSDGMSAEVWTAPREAQIAGGPAITADGSRIALSVNGPSQSCLYVMDADGSHARVVARSAGLCGPPAWAPDGRSLVVAASDEMGVPHVCKVSPDGGPLTPIVPEYSLDPMWAPDGSCIVYSGPDIGTTFHVRAVTPEGAPVAFPNLILMRGARRLAFLGARHSLVALKGESGRKGIWLIDLQTGTERPLTNLGSDAAVRDFDISRDGRELVIEQVQEHSDIVRIDLAPR